MERNRRWMDEAALEGVINGMADGGRKKIPIIQSGYCPQKGTAQIVCGVCPRASVRAGG